MSTIKWNFAQNTSSQPVRPSNQILQQLGMLVQKPEEIDDCGERGRLAAFVAREGVMAAAGQACCSNLAQAELAADAADFPALPLAVAQHELVARRRVAPCAVGVELDFAAARTAPARQPLHRRGHAGMLDGEGLAFEARHTLAGLAARTLPRHGHFSLNWITGAASRNVIL